MDLIESLFQKSDFLAFTVQTSSDFKKLSDQLQGRRPGQFGLNDITIRNMPGAVDNFRSPVSEDEMRRFGFEGWALDHVNGPETVMAMLCHYVRLHNTGVALRDINNQQFEMLQNSNIGSWVAGKSSYQITRRSEYGPGATSTRVRDIRKASIWTDQPVDLTAKRELQSNIEGWSEELLAFKRQQDALQTERNELRHENDDLERERVGDCSCVFCFRVTLLTSTAESPRAREDRKTESTCRIQGTPHKARCVLPCSSCISLC